MTKTDVEEVRS
uniref:Uncharacterized protein n=1 Tax=Arundo donax TaxID=35708 RepID=A0A0A8YSV3_ARUDO